MYIFLIGKILGEKYFLMAWLSKFQHRLSPLMKGFSLSGQCVDERMMGEGFQTVCRRHRYAGVNSPLFRRRAVFLLHLQDINVSYLFHTSGCLSSFGWRLTRYPDRDNSRNFLCLFLTDKFQDANAEGIHSLTYLVYTILSQKRLNGMNNILCCFDKPLTGRQIVKRIIIICLSVY